MEEICQLIDQIFDFETNESTLQHAVLGGYFLWVKYLLNQQVPASEDLLYIASEEGFLDIIKLLIQYGVNDFTGAIKCAAQRGNVEIVRFLIDQGGDPYDNNCEGLLYAAEGGNRQLIELLYKPGTKMLDIVEDPYGDLDEVEVSILRGVLRTGIYFNYFDIVDFSFDEGYYPGIIKYTINYGTIEMLKYLKGKGCDIGNHFIVQAAKGGRIDMIEYFVENGAEITLEVLGGAIYESQIETVKYLIKKGAKLPIDIVKHINYYSTRMVKCLIKLGVDVNQALLEAVKDTNLGKIEVLVDLGAIVDTQVLHIAANVGNLEIVKYLVEHSTQASSLSPENYRPAIQAYLASL